MDVHEWEFFEEQIASLVLKDALSLPRIIGEICGQNLSRNADTFLLGAISSIANLDDLVESDSEKCLL